MKRLPDYHPVYDYQSWTWYGAARQVRDFPSLRTAIERLANMSFQDLTVRAQYRSYFFAVYRRVMREVREDYHARIRTNCVLGSRCAACPETGECAACE